jgi:hypothetical protein
MTAEALGVEAQMSEKEHHGLRVGSVHLPAADIQRTGRHVWFVPACRYSRLELEHAAFRTGAVAVALLGLTGQV